jgi:hypothetical protein
MIDEKLFGTLIEGMQLPWNSQMKNWKVESNLLFNKEECHDGMTIRHPGQIRT